MNYVRLVMPVLGNYIYVYTYGSYIEIESNQIVIVCIAECVTQIQRSIQCDFENYL